MPLRPFYRRVSPRRVSPRRVLVHKYLKNILKQGAFELGVSLGDKEVELFLIYLEELKKWNKKINLTSIVTDEGIITRHFLDSLTPYKFLKNSKKLLDIGSGAGFPGIPLKVVLPELSVTLMDSVEKKVHFTRHIIRTLGIENIEAVAARAEDKEVIKRYCESFDSVISRAFTGLRRFLSLSLPYLQKGGMIIAMKGPAAENELEEVEGLKGIEPPELHKVNIPFTDRVTCLVVFRKTG